MNKIPTDKQLEEMNKFQKYMESKEFIIVEKKYADELEDDIIVSPRFVMRSYLQSKGGK